MSANTFKDTFFLDLYSLVILKFLNLDKLMNTFKFYSCSDAFNFTTCYLIFWDLIKFFIAL